VKNECSQTCTACVRRDSVDRGKRVTLTVHDYGVIVHVLLLLLLLLLLLHRYVNIRASPPVCNVFSLCAARKCMRVPYTSDVIISVFSGERSRRSS
jgi:hypothetical protein